MTLHNIEARIYFNKQEHQRLFKEVNARRSTVSATVRECLNEYFALQEDLANAITLTNKTEATQSGKIIHNILARTEARLEIKLNEIQQQQKLMMVMIECLYKDTMQFCDELPPDIAQKTKKLAEERYTRWLVNVNQIARNTDNH